MQNNYIVGVFWAIFIGFWATSNDVLMRFLGERLHGFEVIFFRAFFTLLTLIPFAKNSIKMQRPSLHAYRAAIGICALLCAFYAVKYLPLAHVTIGFFSQSLFFLPLASIFLKESVGFPRIIATLLGFTGIIIAQMGLLSGELNFGFIFPLTGALLFAFLDVFNKKMVSNESYMSLLFSFALGTTILAFPLAMFVWMTPTINELLLLFLLGIGGNMIQVCVFKAFQAADASSLAPFRYCDLVFSSIFGWLIFGEVHGAETWIGAAVIIFSTLYLTYYELSDTKKIAS
jgi:S-adenosylmethionine uptake transporter